MNKLKVRELDFEIYLEEKVVKERVAFLAKEIYQELNGEVPHFVAVLNGSFIFASDLLRAYPGDCTISFVKLSSYQGVKTSGKVQELIGLETLKDDQTIVVLEDIVDTGTTLLKIDEIFKQKEQQWRIASLFYKPESYKGSVKVNFVGFEIPNDFIVGYGLDYDGFGRNMKNVYQLAKA